MASKRKMPHLKADTITLFNLYYGTQLIDAKDISAVFKVGKTTARNVINTVREIMTEEGINVYCEPTVKCIPTNKLFDVYGWDIGQITRNAKVLEKRGMT